jgi:hypothetical protein
MISSTEKTMKIVAISINLLLAWSAYGQANAVTDWATIVQPAIHNAAAPRPPASAEVLHTMIALAVYDAVMAVKGGYRPYALGIRSSNAEREEDREGDGEGGNQRHARADVRAAVATAAYHTARARVAASQYVYLDAQYVNYMVTIPAGPAKTAGIEVGQAAANAILAARANDGFSNAAPYACSSNPPPAGEFEPNGGCGTQPVDVHLGQVKPFTFSRASRFRPDGPDPITSNAYVEDFTETRDYGRSDSTLRSSAQTDIAYFWSEHAYVHWNRNLISLAIHRGLDVRDTARFFAIVHTAVADAVIAGFEAKYFYRFWRPRTAIPRAAEDENPDTDPDPTWTPLLTVNHPEYPAAHGFWSTALTDAVARFFGTSRVVWTIATSQAAVPQVIQAERTYRNLNAVMREIDSARIWGGLHWRHSMRHGGQIGRKVAKHVCDNFFRPSR